MDHCSSEGATLGIQSYLFKSKISVQKKISKPKTISIQFQIKTYFNFISKSISEIIFQNFSNHFKNQIKMSENIELNYVWDHTISKIFLYFLNSKMGNIIKEWVVFNKLEDFYSLLEYSDDDFKTTGKLCYII